jgi:SNF2 domain-containing protein/EH signature protein/restriction endonuclease/helicase-like protein
MRQTIQNYLLDVLGDPRIEHGAWLRTDDSARDVFIRWLAQATLEQFLKVVDRLAPRHQWDYRRVFWNAYIEKGAVANAWVAFGSSGAQVANQIAKNTADQLMLRFGTLTGGGADQAVLLLSIGDLVIADWSHNGKLRIWRRGNKRAPEFNLNGYIAADLRAHPDFETVHLPPDGWQMRTEAHIRRHTGIRLNEAEYIGPLRDKIKEARRKGEAFVEFGEDSIPVPATAEAEQSLSTLLGAIKPNESNGGQQDEEAGSEREESKQKRVLIVEENFDALGFTRPTKPRTGDIAGLPAAIRPTLKAHQRSGLAWLQETWLRGYPGVLLADDMGLGKTLQALAFLARLREARTTCDEVSWYRGPFLIVAPTGLLANWENEHNLHLHEPGLGEICRAYGRHLKPLKIASTQDVDRGAPALDHRRIQQADWVLTTYETLRDYHLSFAAIPFACVVFDEVQKVKSPASLPTRAAKTINSEYILGLTGTPIENHLVDLWSIMDIVNPGCLVDLKSFCATYHPDDMAALENLRATLLDSDSKGPAPILRRMKTDHLEGLPEKKIHIRKRRMPETQAQIYANVVARAKQPESGPMLETLHLLRGVSLHPIWPPAGEASDQQSFIEQSARLTETFLILDEIEGRLEKALIFLESLELQDHLALMIKNRYGLKRRPMQINGDVAGEKRQRLVDEFQIEHGKFDVMILSPRAGGVGLTLTSANNVIHLSRWWNPAVEDQCTDRVYRIGQNQTVHVYYPMAVHPHYGEASFDELLNTLLARKRELSRRMLVPPVNLKQDQNWFAENLGHAAPEKDFVRTDIEEIDAMEPRGFERWALSRCVSLGWEVSRTPTSHDGGADGVLTHRTTGARAIIQCKHKQANGNTCGPQAIDDLLRARRSYSGAARLFVLTNAERFSQSARERAQQHGISLIGRAELPDWPQHLL